MSDPLEASLAQAQMTVFGDGPSSGARQVMPSVSPPLIEGITVCGVKRSKRP